MNDLDGSQCAGAPSAALVDLARGLANPLRPAVVGLVLLTVLTGGLFPLLLAGLADTAFSDQAMGSLAKDRGAVVGSRLIGQVFAQPGYFHARPSAAGQGYDATASGGTNLGPSNPKSVRSAVGLAQTYRYENRLSPDVVIPIDAVTSSGSGRDPDISPQNAALQAARVSRARGLALGAVQALSDRHAGLSGQADHRG
jgi:K+-transporting ATPase ATPase C chain